LASILSSDEIEKDLAALPGWEYADGALRRRFVFEDFVEAFGFMCAVALCAERAAHHPDWSNSYRTVEVALSTHSAGGVTELDVALAAEMNRLAGTGKDARGGDR
jgi:4a-hydroxytetrahydrobiopterin dehydratase